MLKIRSHIKSTCQFILVVSAIGLLGFSSAHADIGDGVILRGFSDVSYHDDPDGNGFGIGDLDLFLAKAIDKKVSFLTEIAIQSSYHDFTTEVERFYLQYTVSNWFKISAGRFHTALGYWNETYHHGRYLQTSFDRPQMEMFEDEGGFLPTHTTGVEIRGNGQMGSGNLGYIMSIGNGRGPVKEPSSFFHSYMRSKATNAEIFYEWTNGLRLGASVYNSSLPGGNQLASDGTPLTDPNIPVVTDPGHFIVGPKGTEWIYGVHLVFNSPSVEFLNEYSRIIHTYKDGSTNLDGITTSTKIDAFYSQLGYHMGLFTPFIRYEVDATDHQDAYLNAPTGTNNPGLMATTRYYMAGVRYELSSSSALKAEWMRTVIQDLDIKMDMTTLNWSFAW